MPILILLLVFFSSFAEASTRISVMTYNVENLFDTKDDPKTNDEAYLPLSMKQSPAHKARCKSDAKFGGRLWDCLFLDWNEGKLDQKMKNLSQQILSAPGGRGPDVLTLAEVENKAVVEQLNAKYLGRAGYKVYHIDSHDKRGIEQAILTRFPVSKLEYHEVHVTKKSHEKELRGILHATLEVRGKHVHVLALHLPSQGAPFKEREAVLKELDALALKIPANDALIAGGDFNITSSEWEKEKVYPGYLKDIWTVAYMQNCKGCVGTYWYKGEWSYFDLLLLRFDREKKTRWHWENPQVVNVDKSEHPIRFNTNTGEGRSDHFPFYAELVLD